MSCKLKNKPSSCCCILHRLNFSTISRFMSQYIRNIYFYINLYINIREYVAKCNAAHEFRKRVWYLWIECMFQLYISIFIKIFCTVSDLYWYLHFWIISLDNTKNNLAHPTISVRFLKNSRKLIHNFYFLNSQINFLKFLKIQAVVK